MKKVYRVSAGEIAFLVIAKNKKKARKHVKEESVYANTVAAVDKKVERVKSKKSEILGTYHRGNFEPGILEVNPSQSLHMIDEGAITLNFLERAGIQLSEEQLAKLRVMDAKETRQLQEA